MPPRKKAAGPVEVAPATGTTVTPVSNVAVWLLSSQTADNPEQSDEAAQQDNTAPMTDASDAAPQKRKRPKTKTAVKDASRDHTKTDDVGEHAIGASWTLAKVLRRASWHYSSLFMVARVLRIRSIRQRYICSREKYMKHMWDGNLT